MKKDYPEFSLLELVAIVSQRPWLFLAVALLAPLLAWLATFLITPQYEAVSSLLPPHSAKVQGYSSVLQRGVIRGSLRIRNSEIRNSLNLERLLSRQIRDEMVTRLDLVEFFDLDGVAVRSPALARERAAERLLKATHLELSLKVRVLIVHVVTADPAMSARIANTYIELLDAHNLATVRSAAAERVTYLDTQIDKLRATRAAAETRLADYARGEGIADLESQSDSALQLLAQLRSHLLGLEIDQERLRADLEEDSPLLAVLAAEIDTYQKLVERFTVREAPDDGAGGEYLLYLDFPLAETEGHGLFVARLQRELDLIDSLIGAMVAERERNRMEQHLNVSTTSILDRAVPPVEPIWPRKKFIVLVSAFIALVLTYLLLFARAAFVKLAGGGDRAAWRRFLAES